ncbi:MAG: LysR family transcriptional regulator [Nitrospinae bacterium]|nr:LysR family transcriptional regulator [Nitrospinota bacterium]
MKRNSSSRIPATSALVAFESAARLGSLSHAAEELRTSQPAISRLVANLEKQLSVRLFERSRTGVTLTDAGTRFHDAVAVGLGIIRSAASEIAARPGGEQVVITCSHEISHFLLMPQYELLLEALGEHVEIRILTYHYGTQNPPHEPAADIVLAWEANFGSEDRVMLIREAVRPLCSPGYAETHADILNGPVSGWSGITFLDLTRPNQGWASWEDWFRVAGRPSRTPRNMGFDSYIYVLEAAAAGRGIALGWKHWIERYLDSGALVELADGFVDYDNHICGMFTEKGRRNPLAQNCLEFLGHSARYS